MHRMINLLDSSVTQCGREEWRGRRRGRRRRHGGRAERGIVEAVLVHFRGPVKEWAESVVRLVLGLLRS